MKRFLSAFLLSLLVVISCPSFAEVSSFVQHMQELISHEATDTTYQGFDLSTLDLSELIDLRSQIQLAMWETDEWQEVEVPQGVYEIGVDIPAGKWTITALEGQDPNVYYGDVLDGAGKEIVWSPNIYYGELLAGIGGWRDTNMRGQYVNATTIDLKENAYFVVNSGRVLFTPYIGAPVLGFK